MDPVTIYAGLTVASSVASTVSNFKKTQSEREAALNEQALRTLEVNEMKRRSEYNLQLLSRKLNDTTQTALGQMAHSTSGGPGGETSAVVKDTLLSNMTKELERAKIESEFEINLRQREADAMGSRAAALNRTQLLGGISGAVAETVMDVSNC